MARTVAGTLAEAVSSTARASARTAPAASQPVEIIMTTEMAAQLPGSCSRERHRAEAAGSSSSGDDIWPATRPTGRWPSCSSAPGSGRWDRPTRRSAARLRVQGRARGQM